MYCDTDDCLVQKLRDSAEVGSNIALSVAAMVVAAAVAR